MAEIVPEDFAESLIFPYISLTYRLHFPEFTENARSNRRLRDVGVQFHFGDHSLDTDRRELRRGGEPVALEPQVFDLLVYLVQNRDRVVSKDDLLEAVWGGRIVSESALTSRITAVRKAIGDDGGTQRLIRTLPRKGLRFIGSVEEVEQRASPGDTPAMLSESPARAELALPDKPSIAVLPFANLSGDPEQEFFADGMVEEIITALSKFRWFFVIARNSSFTYKGRAVDMRQVGRELGVRYVLEGSVRKAGDRVRVSGQLIEAATGSHLWAERYDRAIADIFALQDEITERVVAAIEPQIYAAEHFRSQRKPPESLDAWECVIRALSYMAGMDAGDAEAKILCRRAIAIAPSYGQAHSLLAWLLIRTSWSGGEVATVLPEAVAEARTALRLDERDSWAHATHGMVLWRSRRHGEAQREFRRALDLNPNFALAHALLAVALAVDGSPAEASLSAEHALRLSPSDRLVDFYAVRAMKYARFADRNYADSLAWARRLVDKYPEYTAGYTWLVSTAALQGDMETAAAAMAVLRRRRPRASLAWMRDNVPHSGDILERLLTGLRIAGLPN
jgi:TolB-like protein/Tfp pilus assembly protein PilF